MHERNVDAGLHGDRTSPLAYARGSVTGAPLTWLYQPARLRSRLCYGAPLTWLYQPAR